MVAGRRMRRLDMHDCIADPAGNCFARTLSRVKGTTRATAEADCCPEFAEEELAFLAGTAGAFRIVVGICLIDLPLEVQQSSAVLRPRRSIERLAHIAFHSKVEVSASGSTRPARSGPCTRKIDGGHFGARCLEEPRDVAQSLAVLESRDDTLVGQRPELSLTYERIRGRSHEAGRRRIAMSQCDRFLKRHARALLPERVARLVAQRCMESAPRTVNVARELDDTSSFEERARSTQQPQGLLGLLIDGELSQSGQRIRGSRSATSELQRKVKRLLPVLLGAGGGSVRDVDLGEAREEPAELPEVVPTPGQSNSLLDLRARGDEISVLRKGGTEIVEHGTQRFGITCRSDVLLRSRKGLETRGEPTLETLSADDRGKCGKRLTNQEVVPKLTSEREALFPELAGFPEIAAKPRPERSVVERVSPELVASSIQREGIVQPLAPLCGAVSDPVPFERDCKPQGSRRIVRERPSEGRSEVVELLLHTSHPHRLSRSAQFRMRLLPKLEEEASVPAVRRDILVRLDQPLMRVLADWLEQSVASRIAFPLLQHDQRLVDQIDQEVEGGLTLASCIQAAHGLSRLDREATRKHGQPPKNSLPFLAERIHAPVERRLQRALPRK